MSRPAPTLLRRSDPLLSVVVPVFNEALVLPAFYQRLQAVVSRLPLEVELVFVDDGSSDDSLCVLEEFASRDQRIGLVSLSRNFGKEAAMSAGLAHAMGDAVVLIDADLQDPPEEIPRMVAAWQAGADLISMQRRVRHGESWLKRITAAAFYRIFQKIADVPVLVDVGDFRLLSRRVVDVLQQLPERQRFMKALFSWPGFRQSILSYDRDPRFRGSSKWGWLRLVSFAMDGITSFSVAPLRLATVCGALISLTAFVFAAWIVTKTLVLGESVAGYPTIMVSMLLLGGIQLLAIGLLGEYVGRLYMESKQRPLYVVDTFRAAKPAQWRPSTARHEV